MCNLTACVHAAAIVTNLTTDQMIVNESDSIRVSCEARGSPPLMISWQTAMTPNHVVRLSENAYNTIITNSDDSFCNITAKWSIIEIHSARVEDSIEYICQAQNLPNSIASKRLKIVVQSGSTVLLTSGKIIDAINCIKLHAHICSSG